MSAIRRLFWRGLDPLLLRLRSRLSHLDDTHPAQEATDRTRSRGLLDETVRLGPEARIGNHGARANLTVGPHCVIFGEVFAQASSAKISIGRNCFVGAGSRIWAQKSVTIGSYVLIAHLVDIHDTDAHSLDWRLRREDTVRMFERGESLDWTHVPAAPVVIEDDVWIGFKSSILKGVRLGRGSVVAAGSVVTKDVAPFTLVGGSPARILRQLEENP